MFENKICSQQIGYIDRKANLNKIRRVGPQSSTVIVLCPQGSDVRTSLVAVETEESKSMNNTPLVEFLRKLEE